ncbi:RNA polymerase sigma-70 factor (ECF subfamily) [Microbacteriaceae bacterium SG_E_30_P1]|uniref:RNA polymerase sigma-70 factor (ECF subfamily) n=1 Tax=Antiquaquibacter oligotrophicus TaxID=2880260 RepID=A0ABT6KNV4_9MICO|nr:RNA polymerase sigma-70 factor [Antiquaquibacter oligotrophicus]MDH6181133.1 RNA polymerase sigma-70 factor (ECF subfamily) [Antiquaquibacter oligotrophicus]UDF13170.1 RNA polymerase sigma-70 factor [Antiquaquibacter oligotrophicus]
MTSTDVPDQLSVFEQNRARMFGIAYRMLGSVAEAEDIVQDAWIRWNRTSETIDNPGAFLATMVTRLTLTTLDSARVRRESYIGPWLPEPVDTSRDPLLGAERAEALSLAVLLLLERLTPAERAAYVLREAFDYPFRDIADVLETNESNARQLATRARKHIERERGVVVSGDERSRLLAAFLAAAQSGDVSQLEHTLAADVRSHSDGGGVVGAARNIVGGRDRVAALLVGVIEKFAHGIVMHPVIANGEPAVLGVRDGEPAALWTVDIADDGVSRIMIVLNPHKLEGFRELATQLA